VLAYQGTDPVDPVAAFASAADTGNTVSHRSPVTNVAGSGQWVVTAWSDKSSETTGWTPPAGVTIRATGQGAGSGRITALYADSGDVVPAGSYGDLTAVTNAASRATMWTIVLAPAP